MVAKVNGLSRLSALVKDLNDASGSAADALAEELQSAHDRIKTGIALASQNVRAVTATADGLDAFNAAFGNGGPALDPLESSSASPSASGSSPVNPR